MIGRWGTTTPTEDERIEPKGFDAYDLRLGDIMRGERATLGKSLLDVQRELKIKATYIAAIENADPSAFETPGFIAGYVRSYARYLGLDPEWAYDTFCLEGNFTVAHGMSPAASSKRQAKSEQRDVKRDPLSDPNAIFVPRGEKTLSKIQPGALGSVAVLAMLVMGIGYGGWSVLQEIQKVEFAPIDQAPGVVAEVEGLSDITPTMTASAGDTVQSLPTPDALDRLYRPQALDVPVLVARDGPIAAIDPRSAELAGVGSVLAGIPPSVDQAPDLGLPLIEGTPVQVVEANLPDVAIFAVRPAWVRVQSADGTVLFEKILDAGERYVVPATQEPPILRSGNAGSVYFAVNGATYGPAGAGPSVVKNVALAVDTLKGSYAVADLSKDAALADYVAVAQAEGTLISPATE